MILNDVGSNLISFKLFIQHCPTFGEKKKSVIVSSKICTKTFEMANSVDKCGDEFFSQEPIVLKTPRKRDYNEIAEDATRSTSCIDNNHPTLLDPQCWAMLHPIKQALILPFGDQKSANIMPRQLTGLESLIGRAVGPVFTSRKIRQGAGRKTMCCIQI